MPVVGSSAYGTIEEWANLVRVFLNDAGLSGAGRIFTDSNPAVLPILNDSLATVQRRLQNQGVTTNVKEWFSQTNYPVLPVNGPLGAGVPDPSIQQFLGYNGFYDGYLNYPNPSLPIDCLVPLDLWERTNGTQLTYTSVDEAQKALESCYQSYSLGNWEWRGDAIWWNGALISKDVRLRYVGSISYVASTTPVSSFPTTTLPFRDCITALAYLGAEKFAAARVPGGATADLQAKAERAIDEMANRYVRRAQNVVQNRPAYGYD